jgi:hypothetical protein
MKNIFCLLFLFVFAPYPTAHAGDRPKDFQGVLWGTQVSKVEGLVPKKESLPTNLPPDILEKIKETLRESEEKGEKIFLRPSDILRVPSGEVRAIEYLFVKDLFAQGLIYFNDYPQHLNFVKIYARLYGAPDNVEKDETMIKHSWYTENDEEGEVILFYNPLIKAGYVSMKWKAFLKKEIGLISGDDSRMKAGDAAWQLFREDENGKCFYYDDRLARQDKDVLEIQVKCTLSAKRQNEWRISLKSKIMPYYAISIEEIKCSSKETRNLQFVILSENGPLKIFQNFQESKWELIAPDSMAEGLYKKVCK